MDMLTPKPYGHLNKYPGMRMGDEVIWDEFVKNHPDFFLSVWYNVPLGEPFPDEDAAIEAAANGALEVSQWRIDVLGETADTFVVIELRPHADARAIGNVIAYSKLFEKEWEPVKPVVQMILTDQISPIMETAAALCHVRLMVP